MILELEPRRNGNANGHDQLELFLNGARRDAQLRGDLLIAVAVEPAQGEDFLLTRGQRLQVGGEVGEQAFGVGGIVKCYIRRHHVVDIGSGGILYHRSCLNAPRPQMVQRQIACSLKNERFQMFDSALAESAGDTQVSFLKQVFGGARVADHLLQGTQEDCSACEKYSVEVRLSHGDTRPENQRMIMIVISL